MRARGLALAALFLGGSVAAHVRLINPSNGNELFWNNPGNIDIVISSMGSDNINDDSHFTALGSALTTWSNVGNSAARFVENSDPDEQSRVDWEADDIHLIYFDENNSSGFFPTGSGTVAVTPIEFFSNGEIVDADVLYNGSGFDFTTTQTVGSFDVESIGAHELGHLLGLDHSGAGGATMYPFVNPAPAAAVDNSLLPRSVALSDERGMRDAYPSGANSTITGTVRRASNNSVVAGAQVFALNDGGRNVAGALSGDNGAFRMEGLDPGNYTLYATPLDFPVNSGNLTPGRTIETDFQSTFGNTVVVGSGQTVGHGNLMVDSDVAVSLGRSSNALPLRGIRGEANTFILTGSGLAAGSSLVSSDPSVTVSVLNWSGSSVTFVVGVNSGEGFGHVDLQVTNGSGHRSFLPSAIEVTPRDPTVTSVVPTSGGGDGGTTLTLTGTNFNSGARVVIGPVVYRGSDVTVVNDTTIMLTTQATPPGSYDVVVVDRTGVEGRAAGAYLFANLPEIDSVFPPAGTDAGGTEIVILGSNFFQGVSVFIDGVQQSNLVRDSFSKLTVTTEAGTAGDVDVEVRNPGGQSVMSTFSYVTQADPTITSVSPDSGSSGTVVTLTGTNFTSDTEVLFGANADSGQGGSLGTDVNFISATTIEVTAPSLSSGDASVLVRDTVTGQAFALAGAFTFSSGGGGGGGCSLVPVNGPPTWRDAMSGAGWFVVVLGALLLAQARRVRRLASTAR